jgi:predicted nucleic acid-binding Zn ribbon protein
LSIEDHWEKIMGKTIANYTDKIEIRNKTLFIYTTVAPLKNELVFQKELIIQRVNEQIGADSITEVVVV